MGEIAAALRDAWRDYRRWFRDLWIASALVSLPVTFVALARGTVAARADLPLSALSEGALHFVESLGQILTPAAVALLAADLRAGGTWGWRQAWRRALARVEPIVSGHLATIFCLLVSIAIVALILRRLNPGLDGPGSKAIAAVVTAALVSVWFALLALQPVVTSIERAGGFVAVHESVRVLGRSLRRNLASLVVAQSIAILPALLVLWWLWPRSGMASVERDLLLGLFFRVYSVSVLPFVTLVALSVYWDARDASGAGAGRLRADLDA